MRRDIKTAYAKVHGRPHLYETGLVKHNPLREERARCSDTHTRVSSFRRESRMQVIRTTRL